MSAQIHPTAIVSPEACIGDGTTVGPYCVIGPKVSIGPENQIASHVVIDGCTSIGFGNRIFQFLGSIPQDLKYKGEQSLLEIGNNNQIREYVTMNPGTAGGGMLTKIGNGNLFMVNSHVGHDSFVQDGNVIANGVALAGHVNVGSHVIVGGLAAVHQFVRIGDHAFIGGGSMVNLDIAPYCIAQGDRAELVGINKIGLARHGVSAAEISSIEQLYRQVFLGPGVLRERMLRVEADYKDNPLAMKLISFMKASERGCTVHRKRSDKSTNNLS